MGRRKEFQTDIYCIIHFGMGSADIRVGNLMKKWDDAVLGVGEHPDQLWTELTSINQNLKKLGEELQNISRWRMWSRSRELGA